jgi:hypothetical protein
MVGRDPCLKYICPVCEASPQERCHVMVGVICFESHRQRMELAKNTPPPEHAFADVHHLPRRWQAS